MNEHFNDAIRNIVKGDTRLAESFFRRLVAGVISRIFH